MRKGHITRRRKRRRRDAEIVGHKVFFNIESDVMEAVVYLQTQEDIGKVVYLEE